MNEESVGLIIFALIALGAVFAFIFVLGGPEATGQLAGTQKLGTSTFEYRDAVLACSRGTHCSDGLPGIPTGLYDPIKELYQCRCSTSDPTFEMWRSVWQ